jgi:hypothetical protein
VHHGKFGGQCLSWVIRVGPKQAAASPDVRFTSDSDQTGASQRSDALCQSRHFAPQQNRPLLDHLVGAGKQRWYRAVFLNHALATS